MIENLTNAELFIDEHGVVWLVVKNGLRETILPVLVDVPGNSHYGCLRVKADNET